MKDRNNKCIISTLQREYSRFGDVDLDCSGVGVLPKMFEPAMWDEVTLFIEIMVNAGCFKS